jgi:hypothetical protein
MGKLLLLILAVMPYLDVIVLGPTVGTVSLDKIIFSYSGESGFCTDGYSIKPLLTSPG